MWPRGIVVVGVALLFKQQVDASVPEYPTVKDLVLPGTTFPKQSTPNQLVSQEHSVENVVIPFQGPDLQAVQQSNTQQTSCPHSLRNLKPWDDANTWDDGTVPFANPEANQIVLPENTRVIITKESLSATSSMPYSRIVVPTSSHLIFDDADIEMHTLGIIVNGKLSIGSETCRIRSNIKIVLHGKAKRTSTSKMDLDDNSLKAIQVTGILDIHGVRYGSTWSRLALTATKGENVIVLHEPVNWESGQRIVITTTAVKDTRDWHRNEEHVIVSVESVRYDNNVYSVIRLEDNLRYNHIGGREYQAEVGLLSRRIVIQGDDNSEPTDTYPVRCTSSTFRAGYPCSTRFLTGYGGHVIVSGASAIGRVSGVEFYRMGQTNILGRYPFHFHMLGDNGSKSYLQDSSIWRSFYRCVSVHGTNYSRLSRNVAFDVIGSCFYLEDAVEEENTFEYNLAAHIHVIGVPATSPGQWMPSVVTSSTLLNPADVSASGFYITNAYNTFVGNAASGGYAGFLIVTVPRALGLHAMSDVDFQPESRPTLLFDGNSAHSSGYWWRHGGAIYVGGFLEHPDPSNRFVMRYNGGRLLGGRLGKTTLTNSKVFLSTLAVNHWGKFPEIIALEARDVAKSANIFGRATITNMLVECRTKYESMIEKHYSGSRATSQESYYFRGRIYGFAWYDTGQRHILKDVTFRNCNGPRAYVWNLLTHSNQHVPEFLQSSSGIKYENVNTDRLFHFSVVSRSRPTYSSQLTSWMDADGSASMRNGKPTIIGSYLAGKSWWYLDSKCEVKSRWNVVLCDRMDTRSIGSIHVEAFDSITAGQGKVCSNGSRLPCPNVGYANRFGQRGSLSNGLPLRHHERITGPVGGGIGWHVNFDDGVPQHLVVYQTQLARGRDLVVAFPHPKGAPVKVYANTCRPEDIVQANTFRKIQLKAWQNLFDGTKGLSWYRCRGSRNNPCSCKSGSRRVECNGLGLITGLFLPNNKLTAEVFPIGDVKTIVAFPGLKMINLSGNRFPKLTSQTCVELPKCSEGVSCNFGTTTRACKPGETPLNEAGIEQVVAEQLKVWQAFYDAFQGNRWYRCRNTRDDPCSCSSGFSRRVYCDSFKRITKVTLRSNRLTAQVFPEDALDSLLSLSTMTGVDLRYNYNMGKPETDCLALKLCDAKECKFSSTIQRLKCEVVKGQPTISPTMAPSKSPTQSPSTVPTISPTGERELPCTIEFTPANNVVDFLGSKGAKYFVDEGSNNIFLLLRPQTVNKFSFENPFVDQFGEGDTAIPNWSKREVQYHIVRECNVYRTRYGGRFCRLGTNVSVPQCGWHCFKQNGRNVCDATYDPKNEAESFCGADNSGFTTF